MERWMEEEACVAAHTDAFTRKRHVFHHGTRARRTRWMRDDEGLITRRGVVKEGLITIRSIWVRSRVVVVVGLARRDKRVDDGFERGSERVERGSGKRSRFVR